MSREELKKGRFIHETKTVMDPGDDEPVTVKFNLPGDSIDVTKILEWEELRSDLQRFMWEATGGAGDLYLKKLEQELRKKWGL